MPDPLDFDDYRSFLRAWTAADRRRTNRQVAQGIRCSAALWNAILSVDPDKQRPMGPAIVLNFCRFAKLSAEDAEAFGWLVALEHGSRAERELAEVKINARRRFRAASLLLGPAARFLEHWYHPVIFELARCHGFRAEPAWIAGALHPPIDEASAARALELIRALGLLRVDEAGRDVPVDDARMDLSDPDAREALLAWHRWLCARAVEAIDAFSREERFFNAVTVAVPEALVPEISQKIVDFQTQILELCGQTAEPRERVYQLNVQLYPVSRRSTG